MCNGRRGRRLRLATVLLSLAVCGTARGWGTPHVEITRHALRALPASDDADARLGGLRQMEDLSWGGDYQGYVHPDYYVDDYLLFPEFPRHSSHLMPEVASTWKPFFRRTLQALRGESPRNAARWLGSFLHFVQDSGSPPHALPISGIVHTRMENYVLPLALRLPAYRPREFAAGDEAAAAGVEVRLRELVAFSRARAERLLPLAERDDRAACEPLEHECAVETMRAVVDVTHAALRLSAAGPRPGTAAVRGTVTAPADPGFPLAPTRILVEGTGCSTVADAGPRLPGVPTYQAAFVLGDLPPGAHSLLFMRTGCRTRRIRLRLKRGQTAAVRLTLESEREPGNRVRNPDLSVRWLRPGAPDCWTRAADGWHTTAFPVAAGSAWKAGARDEAGPRAVTVRLAPDPRMAGAQSLAPEKTGRLVMPGDGYAELVVHGDQEPAYAYAAPGRP